MPTETSVKDAVMRFLKTLAPAGAFWRAGATMYGKSGVSDILGVYKGVPIAIEVKKPGGKHPVTPNQLSFIGNFHEAGGKAVVVTSVQEVRDLVAELNEEIDERP